MAALRHGAFDYLTKPCKLADLEAVLSRVAEKTRADQQVSGPEAAAAAAGRLLGTGRRVARRWQPSAA